MCELEKTLLKQLQTCDQQVLAAVYDEYHPRIYRYLFRRIGEVEIARDLTADVFGNLINAVHKGNCPEHNLKAWLYRTAHNIVVDYYRKQNHREDLQLNESNYATDDDMAISVEQRMTTDHVREALNELTPDQQQVIYLRFLEGFSNEEVALCLGKTVGAVKSLQHRGIEALRRKLSVFDWREKT